jgi:hypothetical protein
MSATGPPHGSWQQMRVVGGLHAPGTVQATKSARTGCGSKSALCRHSVGVAAVSLGRGCAPPAAPDRAAVGRRGAAASLRRSTSPRHRSATGWRGTHTARGSPWKLAPSNQVSKRAWRRKVAPSKPASPWKLAWVKSARLNVGRPEESCGAAARIASRSGGAIGTPRASSSPVALSRLSAAACVSGLAWARHAASGTSGRRTAPLRFPGGAVAALKTEGPQRCGPNGTRRGQAARARL